MNSSIIVYGGQGNVSVQNLKQLQNTTSGENLIAKLKKSDVESYERFQKILVGEMQLADIHASLLATFIYNEWITDYSLINENTYFSAHSAGIFNVLLASNSASFEDIIMFLKKRADLLKKLERTEELWLMIANNAALFQDSVRAELQNIVDISIISDDKSLVIAMDKVNKTIVEESMKAVGIIAKLKQLHVAAPYHSKFLNNGLQEYSEMVHDLKMDQNEKYNYLFENEDLKCELVNQWNHVFDWYTLKRKMIEKNITVYDLSPNKFISKQLSKLKLRGKDKI